MNEKLLSSCKPPPLSPYRSLELYQRRFATALDLSAVTEDVLGVIGDEYHMVARGSGDTLSRLLPMHLLEAEYDSEVTMSANRLALCVSHLQCEWLTHRCGLQIPTLTHQPTMWVKGRIQALAGWAISMDRKMYALRKDQLSKRHIPSESLKLPETQDLSFHLHGDFCGVKEKATQTVHIFPLCVLSMFVSKSLELAVLLYYLSISGREDRSELLSSLRRYLLLLQRILLRHGNQGYTVMKSIDGLCQGITIVRGDKSKSRFLLDNIITSLRNDELMSTDVDRMTNLLMDVPLMDVMNYGGISKIMGHPEIDTKAGLEKLYQRTHHPIQISDDAIENVINIAKQMFMTQYHKVHRRYPPVIINSQCPLHISRQILCNQPFTSPRPSDFRGVTLTPICPYDEFERLYPLIKDKAISKSRTEVQTTIDQGNYESLSSRALLDFVMRPSVFKDWRRYMERFGLDPHLCRHQFVVKLTFKELEQKIQGRLFGASPLEERTRRVAMESNICTLMEKYLPDQAMTLTDTEKRMKLYYLRAHESINPQSCQFIVAVDAEAWNNYFRSCLVDRFGEEIFDRIFGCNYFRSVMRVFNQGLIYNVTQGKRITWWDGQEGGIEGLAQKVWTWIYCCIARLVISEVGAEGHLLVNGDDLRMILYMPRAQVELHQDFNAYLLESLKNSFDAYGIRMKVDETVITRDFISFSRQAIINGVNIPSDWKKILKCTGLSDVSLPILSEVISGIFSNAHSAAGQSYTTLPAYTTALWVTCLYLLTDGWFQSNFSKGMLAEYVCILTTPASIGGLEVIMLPTMMMQGESDPIPAFLDWCKYLLTKLPQSRKSLLRILSIPHRSAAQGIMQLVANPYCLPLPTTDSPKAIIRRTIKRYLPRITGNIPLLHLLAFDKKYRKTVLDSLVTMSPFSARVASLLYSLTPPALLDSIISKFEDSSSICQFFMSRNRRKLDAYLKCVFTADYNYLAKRTCLTRPIKPLGVRVVQSLQDGICSTTITDHLRDEVWGLGILYDVTQPAWFQQITMEVLEAPTFPELPDVAEEHFTCILSPAISSESLSGLLARAPYQPYFESHTVEKLCERFSLTGHYEPLFESIRKLTSAAAMLHDYGPSLSNWIDVMSVSLFGEPVSTFAPTITSRVSGTITHRLHSERFKSVVYLNCLPSRSARVNVDLDTNRFTNRVLKENRKYNYVAFRLGITWCATSYLELNSLDRGKHSKVWAYLSPCGDSCSCHNPLTEPRLSIDPLPERFLLAFQRIMTSNLLLRMTPESSLALLEYRIEFERRWGQQQRLVTQVRATQKEAHMAAIIGLLKTVKSQDMRSFSGSVRDLELVNQVSGSKLPLSGYSCRDIILVNPSMLWGALLNHCLLKTTYYITIGGCTLWQASDNCTPKAFLLSLSLHYFTMKKQLDLLEAVNQSARECNIPIITITYQTLTVPETCAIAIIDCFTRVLVWRLENRVCPSREIHLFYPVKPTSAYEDDELGSRYFALLLGGSLSSYRNIETTTEETQSVEQCLERMRQGNQEARYLMAAMAYTFSLLERTNLPYNDTCVSVVQVSLEPPAFSSGDESEVGFFDPILRSVVFLTLLSEEITALIQATNKIIASLSRRGLTRLHIMVYRVDFEEAINAIKVTDSSSEGSDHDQDPGSAIDTLPVRVDFSAYPPEVLIHLFSSNAPDINVAPIAATTTDINSLSEELPYPEREKRPLLTTSLLFRPLRLSTTALNKYLEIFSGISLLQYHRSHTFGVICCGDGSGGVAALCTRIFRKSTVVYNSLCNSEIDAQCIDHVFLTPEERQRLKHDHNKGGISDLCDTHCAEYLWKVLNLRPFLLLTCDAESKHIETSSTDRELLITLSILACVKLDYGGCIIIKRYITPAPWNCAFLSILRYCFEKVAILKPYSSGNASGEIFIVATNLIRHLPVDEVQRRVRNNLVYPVDWEEYVLSMRSAFNRRNLYLLSPNSEHHTTPISTIIHNTSFPMNLCALACPDWFIDHSEVEGILAEADLSSNDLILGGRNQTRLQLQDLIEEKCQTIKQILGRSERIAYRRLGVTSYQCGVLTALRLCLERLSLADLESIIKDSPPWTAQSMENSAIEHSKKEFLKGTKLGIRYIGIRLR